MTRRMRFGGLTLLWAVMLLGCGSDPAVTPQADAATSPTSTVPPTTSSADWAGPPSLIAATRAELVAVDLATGDVTVLAKHIDLARSLEAWWGRFQGVDLSPDGSTVAFAFNGEEDHSVGSENPAAGGLYEVPADGTAPARRVGLDTGDAFVSSPRYSPDGRFLAVYSGDRLAVLNRERKPTGDGVQMAYPPHSLTWTPGGDGLVFVPHFERSPCCPVVSYPTDPATGHISDAPTGDHINGFPYIDSNDELRAVPDDVLSFDVDASGRFVVASDGTSPGLTWWDTTTDEPQRRPLPLEIRLQEAPTEIAW